MTDERINRPLAGGSQKDDPPPETAEDKKNETAERAERDRLELLERISAIQLAISKLQKEKRRAAIELSCGLT
jgi:hypothetical protein